MQVMFNQIDDHQAIQLLLKDLVDNNKDVRYNLILNQIEETIILKWLDFVYRNRCWKRPVMCIAMFHLNDEHGLEQPDSHFTMSARIEEGSNYSIEDYSKRIRNALTDMRFELRNKYDLDRVVFDVVDGQESIEVCEYNGIPKGV